MKYLITGGCGFLGSNLGAQIIRNGEELYVFDNMYRVGSSENLKWLEQQGKINFTYGDIRNRNDIENVVRDIKPDVIFHLAGQVAMTTSISNPRMDFEVNAFGTFNLIEAVRLFSPESTIIYSSTNKVYGDLEQYTYDESEFRYSCNEFPNGFNEHTPLDFHSPYGSSKGCADQYLLDYSRIYGLRTVVFRHSSMFGGRQYASFDQGWLGWFTLKAIELKKGLKTDPFTISGNGKQVRDILYSDDTVSLYLKAASEIEKIKGEAFNIGGGIENSSSLLELFSVLEEEINIKMNYKKLPPRESDQKVFIADISKIKRELNWVPLISKEDGILNMIKWIYSII